MEEWLKQLDDVYQYLTAKHIHARCTMACAMHCDSISSTAATADCIQLAGVSIAGFILPSPFAQLIW